MSYIIIFDGQKKLDMQSTTDKLVSLGDQNQYQHIRRSTYPFENINVKKGGGSGRESMQ